MCDSFLQGGQILPTETNKSAIFSIIKKVNKILHVIQEFKRKPELEAVFTELIMQILYWIYEIVIQRRVIV
jgi:hypothetical protein